MRRCRRYLTGLLALCMAFSICGVKINAAQKESYTYTVTLYAGNQGTFSGGGRIEVVDPENQSVTNQVEIQRGTSTIVLNGLRAGYTVTFPDIQGDAVNVGTDSVYYVRGLRKSGYDNDTVDQPAFKVDQDQDYVVAYGIQGDLVSYVVNYQDAAGNALAESRIYRGNVGDRPVTAFVYIEGYEPQAYNLTRTLSRNEAENVFTFIYSRVSGNGSSGGSAGTEDAEAVGTTATGNVGTTASESAVAAGGTAGGAAGSAAVDAGAGTGTEDTGAGDAGAAIPDEEVVLDQGPEDLIDLDDEETPLANFPVDEGMAEAGMVYGLPVLASLSLVLAAAVLAAVGMKYRAIMKKREKEEEDRE